MLYIESLSEVSVNFGSVVGEVGHTVGVTPFVVVPGDHLDEARVQSNTSLGIKDG